MKAVNKELIIDTAASEDVTAQTPDVTKPNDESSDDDDLFDNLRKMRENTEDLHNVTASKSTTVSNNRKRSRSFDPSDRNGREKMQKIDEDDEATSNKDEDDDDILSFAKKTLQQDELPDTEDILSNIPRAMDGK